MKSKFAAFNTSNLNPRQEDIHHIQDILESNSNGLEYSQIVSKSKLTKSRTLRILEILVEKKTVVRDEIKNIFYLL